MKTLAEVLAEHPATFNPAIEKPWVCLGCMETGVAPVFTTHADHAAHVAAAYREARTITTREQLDALPGETVIRDADGDVYNPAEVPELPALVLWIPEDDS